MRFRVEADRFERARNAARARLLPTAATVCWAAGGELQRPHFGWASLTPVECDVVYLVAEDHSNAAIGGQLFTSVNTVEKHLSHVYTKAEVDGRAHLAAQVARRDV